MPMHIYNQEKNKKAFRPTPTRFQNSLKILAGTKTNSTIRDLDEEEDELEEVEATVVSIERNKINGDGWVVKATDGTEYKCHVASNMYTIPETVEKGGILYPTETIKVKVSISPTLRRNTITEFVDLGDEQTTLDIGKFTHEDEATTVIAKPMSALSVSNSMIKFNYNNTNQVTATQDGVDIDGEATNINTETVSINSKNIQINGQSLTDTINQQVNKTNNSSTLTSYSTNTKENIYLDKSGNTSQLVINDLQTEIPSNEKVILDITNQDMCPIRNQNFSQDNINLKAYTNGAVTISDKYSFGFFSEEDGPSYSASVSWLSPESGLRNAIQKNNPSQCSYCKNKEKVSETAFLNFCPICGWGTLNNYGGHIACTKCDLVFCGTCGEIINKNKGSTQGLKAVTKNSKSINGTSCSFCENSNSKTETKKYGNYCPVCKSWNVLTELENNNKNFLTCKKCNTNFCSNCGINQEAEQIDSFTNKDIYYLTETDNYFEDYKRQRLYYINKENK